MFAQTIPAGEWELVSGDKRSPHLVYRNPQGDAVTVPSIWYNQPVAWRVDYFRFCAQRARENCARHRAMSDIDPWAATMASDSEKQAARLEAAAAEMERTGRFVEV